MVRMIIAAALALVVAFSAAALAQQGPRASRWQAEQFGPIVPTDTMWSIAGYYSRQQGVSLYEMMDSIVAANPQAFRDNRPDFMFTGFFLEIPVLGEGATVAERPAAVVADADDSAEAESVSQPAVAQSAETDTPVDTSVEREIAISVSELQALRTQLSDSIDLIENLQGENSELQERLAAVTRELNLLRARADEEQQASTEMELLAEELSSEELTSDTITAEPEASTPATEDAQPEPETAAPTEPEADVAAEPAAQAEATTETQVNAESDVASETVAAPAQTPVTSKRKQATWIDWLMKPLHLAVLGGLLIILLGLLAYALYVRRVNREIEEGGRAESQQDEPALDAEQTVATAAAAEAPSADESATESTPMDASEAWQETSVDDDYAEVTDVDLDEYLREREGEQVERDANNADAMSKEVDALLAMDFPGPESEAEPEPEVSEPAEDIAEFRVTESEPSAEDAVDSEDQTRGELDAALDSFGGLRLDDDAKDTTGADVEETADEAHKTQPAEEHEDYLSIESLMEEAETEASEEHDDPYDKEKLGDALGGDENDSNEIDLSTEAMLDESKSPAAKLDLAQVYIDMGELDDARDLLESIKDCGDEEAEQDAAELLKKLAEQGGR